MKKIAFLLTSFMLLSCWKNNKEGEQYYAEDNSPIDTTLVDSVVGKTSFSAINTAIEDAKKAPVLKQDTTKSPEQKLAVEKKKIEQKKKSELEKKLAEQNAAENAEKEKAQQEKKVNELVTPE